MAAVASVIKNRADSGQFGTSNPASIATQHSGGWYQFAANADRWHGGNNVGKNASQSSAAYRRAANIVDGVFDGTISDPTGGATYYYAPSGMPNGAAPGWASSMYQTAQIGGHLFYSPSPVPPGSIPNGSDTADALGYADNSVPLPRARPTSALNAIDAATVNQPMPVPLAPYAGFRNGASAADTLALNPVNVGNLYDQGGNYVGPSFTGIQQNNNPNGDFSDLYGLAAEPSTFPARPAVIASNTAPLTPGYNTVAQDQRNALLAVPSETPPLPLPRPIGGPYNELDAAASAPVSAPATQAQAPAQTVNINGHSYQVGQVLTTPAGLSYRVNADGTMTKQPHISLGQNTIAGGIANKAVGDAITTAQQQAPGLISNAGNALGSLFGGLFGGSSASTPNGGSPVPPMDVPKNTTSLVPQTYGPAGGSYSRPYSGGSVSGILSMLNQSVPQTYGPAGQRAQTGGGLPYAGGDPLNMYPSNPIIDAMHNMPSPDWYGGYIPGGVAGSPNYPLSGGGDPSGAIYQSPVVNALSGRLSGSSATQTTGPAAGYYSTPYDMPSGTPTQSNSWTDLISGFKSPSSTMDIGLSTPPSLGSKTTTKYVQQINPAYTDWLNSPFSNPGVQGLSPDDRDSPNGIATAVPGLTSAAFAKPPPQKYILVPQQVRVAQPQAATRQAPAMQAPIPLTLAQQVAAMTPAQIANQNPAALAALSRNSTTYTNNSGTLMPTISISGTIRNTYADNPSVSYGGSNGFARTGST